MNRRCIVRLALPPPRPAAPYSVSDGAERESFGHFIGMRRAGAIDPYAANDRRAIWRGAWAAIIVENTHGASGPFGREEHRQNARPTDNILWSRHPVIHEIYPKAFPNPMVGDQFRADQCRGVRRTRVCSSLRECGRGPSGESSPGTKANRSTSELRVLSGRNAPSPSSAFNERESSISELTQRAAYRGIGLQVRVCARYSGGVARSIPAAARGVPAAQGGWPTAADARRSNDAGADIAERGYPEFTATVWFGTVVKRVPATSFPR